MSLNELLRDSNSNKWANLNVQSVTAVTENVTTINATTVNSVQENTLREVIKAVDNIDHVIDMSKDLQTARIVSKIATTGALQPYELQASNLLWKNSPTDPSEIILAGTRSDLTNQAAPGIPSIGRHLIIGFSTNMTEAGTQFSGGFKKVASGGVGIIKFYPNTPMASNYACANIDEPNQGLVTFSIGADIDGTFFQFNVRNLAGAPQNYTIRGLIMGNI